MLVDSLVWCLTWLLYVAGSGWVFVGVLGLSLVLVCFVRLDLLVWRIGCGFGFVWR